MSEKIQYDKMVNAVKEAIPSFDEVAPHVISNDFFEETINVKGLYNRCTLFDSSLYHAAHVFTGDKEEEDRLIFVNVIFSITNNGKMLKYPVTESFRF